MKNAFCGIDFGTSNTSCAFADKNSKPKPVYVEDNKTSSPSAIFFDTCGSAFYGKNALDKYMRGDEGRFMRSLKRILGTELMASSTIINNKAIKFDAIIERYIKNVKEKIDSQAECNVENVVMGRPVHFKINDKRGDKKAQEELEKIAKAVGFKNVLFQFEPIAAAFAHEAKIEKETLACVIDIGGGTSDFSIIKVGRELSKKLDRKDDVLASNGIRIGGNDFDKDLSIKCFMPSFGMNSTYGGKNSQILPVPTQQYFDLSEWSSINSLYNYATKNMIKKILMQANDPCRYERLFDIIENELGHALLNSVENTKINLTNLDLVKTTLEFFVDKPEILISKKEFETSIKKDTQTVLKSLNECLNKALVKAEEIGLVVLTGGSTEIPYIKETLCSAFCNAQISAEDKFGSVGLGLAYDAKRRFL